MDRTNVFISYSHTDTEWLERLQVHLKPLERDGRIDRWDDTRIRPGNDWRQAIEQALAEAAIAVLLVSADFLASDFIAEEELPPLLEAAEADGVRILPLILSPSQFSKTPLTRFQAVNPPSNPLIGMEKVEQEALLVKLANEVSVAMDRAAPAEDAADRHTRPWNVPERNFFFTGREDLLAAVEETLAERGRALLSGLGGMGKTQIAIEYAYRHRDAYDAVLWVGADTSDALATGFAGLARVLGLPEQHERDQHQVMQAVQTWLDAHDGWLLVFDSANEPEDLLAPFWPRAANGHVLVTSRAPHAQRLGIPKGISTRRLPRDEALDFLLNRTGRDDLSRAERKAAKALAKELGFLPLALEQAAAYLVEEQTSFADYLGAYRRQPLGVLEKAEPVIGRYEGESVAKTWLLNMEQVEATSPAAADLLHAAAFLAPDDIPLEYITGGAAELGPHLATALNDAADDPLAVNAVLKPLTRYSLIRRNVEHRTFSLHMLVQEVTRANLAPEDQAEWERRVLRAMNAVFPYVKFETWPVCERLRPHARIVAARIDADPEEPETATRLLNQIAVYLEMRAQYAEAKPLHRQALDIRQRVLGEEHPDTAQSLNNLASLLANQGKHDEAEPLYRQALDILQRVLGEEHPDAATSLNNLASLLHNQGRYDEAEPLFRQALDIWQRTLGEEHPDTAQSLNNLAVLLKSQSKHDEAEPLF